MEKVSKNGAKKAKRADKVDHHQLIVYADSNSIPPATLPDPVEEASDELGATMNDILISS